jgi:phospholipid transport system substrate-binding protein
MPSRRLVLALSAAALLLAAAPVRTVEAAPENAAAFITEAGNSVMALLNDPKITQAEFKQRLHAIAEQDFDVPRIARFVLGRYWRTASESDRQQFIQAFKDYMVQVYAQRFSDYRGQTFKVIGQRQEGDVSMVTTQIIRPGGQPARVVWQVAKQGNDYKITDVSIEGVSQALTYRDEFNSVIAQNGGQVSALTQQLRQKASG